MKRTVRILTKGFASPTSAFTKGMVGGEMLKLVSINVGRVTGGAGGGGDDDAYCRNVYQHDDNPSVSVATVDEIRDMLAEVDLDEDEVINIVLQYRPRVGSRNIKVECELMKRQITVQLMKSTKKSIRVDLIYKKD